MSDRFYPSRPLVGVGGIVFDQQGRVLIIRRGAEPQRGRWSVPGGLLDVGETLDEFDLTPMTPKVVSMAQQMRAAQLEGSSSPPSW